MTYRVTIASEAERDLENIYRLISHDDPRAAIRFVQNLRSLCSSLSEMPHRGTPRDDGIRTLPFQRRAVVACRVMRDVVVVTNIFYGGRDYEAILKSQGEAE